MINKSNNKNDSIIWKRERTEQVFKQESVILSVLSSTRQAEAVKSVNWAQLRALL